MYSIVEDGGIYFISHPFNEHYVKIGCGRFFVNCFKKALTWFLRALMFAYCCHPRLMICEAWKQSFIIGIISIWKSGSGFT